MTVLRRRIGHKLHYGDFPIPDIHVCGRIESLAVKADACFATDKERKSSMQI
jgi:hypothetical protein